MNASEQIIEDGIPDFLNAAKLRAKTAPPPKASAPAHPAAEAAKQETTMIAIKTSTKPAPLAATPSPIAEPQIKAPVKTKKAAAKKAAKAKARTKVKAGARTSGVRPGSKLEIIVGMLQRPEGCTTKQVLEAVRWPAVSMPQQARAAGLKLKKEKVDGITIYRAA